MPQDSFEQDQALWASVVLQAKDDIESLPFGSPDYEAAAAFFVGTSAYWRRGRSEIAEHLGTTGDTLKRIGTAWVIARRRREGLADHPSAPAQKPKPCPVPVPVETKALVIPPALAACLAPRRRLPRSPKDNPFSTSYRRVA